MTTKEKLLQKMEALGACGEATEYVRRCDSDCAETILRSTDRNDWLWWLAGRVLPSETSVATFAAADRAVRIYAPKALRAAGLDAEARKLEALPEVRDPESARTAKDAAADARAAARTAYDAAYYAVRSAYYAARFAAYDAECSLQLDALGEMIPALVAAL